MNTETEMNITEQNRLENDRTKARKEKKREIKLNRGTEQRTKQK